MKCKSQKTAFLKKVKDEYGGLSDFWYPISLGSSIKTGNYKKVHLFNTNLIIWRHDESGFSVFPDSCVHQKSPLGGYKKTGKVTNGLQCPYHGWEYNKQGKCIRIPIVDNNQINENIKLFKIPHFYDGTLLWIYPGNKRKPEYENTPSENLENDIHYEVDFTCNIGLLIENFLDTSHTGFVHKNIIRTDKNLQSREVTITTNRTSVLMSHSQSDEKIGMIESIINPQKKPVFHTDHFEAPNKVDIKYIFGDESDLCNFRTRVFMCPVDESNSKAIILINTNFSRFNKTIRTGLRLIAPVVIYQDFKILDAITKNKKLLPDYIGGWCDYDKAWNEIRNIRHSIKNEIDINNASKIIVKVKA